MAKVNASNGIERAQNVCAGAPVIEGTRIPTRAILSFFMAGHGVADILLEYPSLTALQVEQAIRFECCATCKCAACAWARELDYIVHGPDRAR